MYFIYRFHLSDMNFILWYFGMEALPQLTTEQHPRARTPSSRVEWKVALNQSLTVVP